MKLNKYFENFILVCIVLVLIQTFLEDYSYIKFWNSDIRQWILVAGFIFDLIFSIEFIIRTIISIKNKNFIKYFFYERGWVDFLSSIPLLLFNSGPYIYFIFTKNYLVTASIGVLNILKVVKGIRVARILRLIRILKIFGKIQNTDSVMAQRHIARIITTGVFSIIIVLFIFSFVPGTSYNNLIEEKEQMYRQMIKNFYIIKTYTNINLASNIELDTNKDSNINTNLNKIGFNILKEFFIDDNDFVEIKYNNRLIFANPKAKYYNLLDFYHVNISNFKIKFSLYGLKKIQAVENIKYFFIIIVLVLFYLLIYTKHFAQTVSDVIFVIFKGIKQKDYFLEVKIHKYFEDDEIYKFAKFYNDIYLPAKQKLYFKKRKKEDTIKFDDIFKFKD